MDAAREARAGKYVDSPDMKLRRREGDVVSARIFGSVGIYHVSWNTKTGRGECSCPADGPVCKHMDAVRLTWQANPGSFLAHNPHRPLVLRRGGPSEDGDDEDEVVLELHDRRIQAAVKEALKRFQEGEFESMGEAALAVADEKGLRGDSTMGDTGELFFLLEKQCPAETLWDWIMPRKQRQAKLAEKRRLAKEQLAKERKEVLETVRLTPEREAYVHQVALRIYRRFRGGLYPSMPVALSEAPTAFGLDETTGEPRLLQLIVTEWCPVDRLQDWPPGPAPRFMSAYLFKLGFVQVYGRREDACEGCKLPFSGWEGPFGFSRRKDVPHPAELDGKRVHMDFECIARCFGQDSPVVMQLEEKLRVPRDLDPAAELRKSRSKARTRPSGEEE